MASTIKVNTITTESGSTVTLGESGKTIALACGATQTGFGRTGTVDWCTTVKTSPLTAVSGKGYFINTCGGAVTVTLPSSPTAGDIVSLKDYKDTWGSACKAVTLGRNSSKIGGNCIDATLNTTGQSITMIYVDGTQGWENIQTDTTVKGIDFIQASGGTETTSGDYKIHTFTEDGTFSVSALAGTTPANNTVSYMVVAGGGGGAGNGGNGDASGGGGAGGFREGTTAPVVPYTASPLVAPAGITVTATSYPITVGGGGAKGTPSTPGANRGVKGSNSVFSTITSAGGGGGNSSAAGCATVQDGGSGGGGGGGAGSPISTTAGVGNTPPTPVAQGKNGGTGHPGGTSVGGGGGGATVQGTDRDGSPGCGGGPGGTGATTSINATPTAYAGGGGGGSYNSPATSGGTGGAGGGGDSGKTPGNPALPGEAGTDNTGGGGGAGSTPGSAANGGAGGSGVVILRYKYQ